MIYHIFDIKWEKNGTVISALMKNAKSYELASRVTESTYGGAELQTMLNIPI